LFPQIYVKIRIGQFSKKGENRPTLLNTLEQLSMQTITPLLKVFQDTHHFSFSIDDGDVTKKKLDMISHQLYVEHITYKQHYLLKKIHNA
jgi:hypothetical protein